MYIKDRQKYDQFPTTTTANNNNNNNHNNNINNYNNNNNNNNYNNNNISPTPKAGVVAGRCNPPASRLVDTIPTFTDYIYLLYLLTDSFRTINP